MRKTLRIFLLAASGLCPCVQLAAQPPSAGGIPLQEAVRQNILAYQQASLDALQLNRGPLYPGYPFPMAVGHQYYLSNRPLFGTLQYNGLVYEHVPLLFDEVQEWLIYQGTTGRIILAPENITGFSIQQTRFVRPLPASQGNAPPAGWYQLLLEGKVQLLKKEKKRIVEETSLERGVEHLVLADAYYYLFMDGRYHALRSSHQLINLLKKANPGFSPTGRYSKKPGDRQQEADWLQILQQFNKRNA